MKNRKPTYLSFGLSKENYAVSTSKVLEVLESQYITPVPNALEFIEGVIAFRGNIVPVVNIHRKLDIPQSIEKLDDCVIIVFDVTYNNKNVIVGAITDNVNEVIPANNDEIMDVPEKGIRFDSTYLTGMLKQDKNFTFLLDIDKVFEYSTDKF